MPSSKKKAATNAETTNPRTMRLVILSHFEVDDHSSPPQELVAAVAIVAALRHGVFWQPSI
jgi:hypothetical protein